MQPIVHDVHGVVRFKTNRIVEFLLVQGGIDMNQLGGDRTRGERWAEALRSCGSRWT